MKERFEPGQAKIESERAIIIEKIENFRSLGIDEKVDLLLILGGFKKASEENFESDEWYDGQDQRNINDESLAQFEKLLEETGLIFKKKIEVVKSRVAHQEDNYQYIRNIQRVSYIIASMPEVIEKYKKAAEESDDKLFGEIYGFPKTSIEAYGKTDETMNYQELPHQVRDSEEYAFAIFKLSRNNWKEELKTVRRWSEFVKQVSPKIYQEYIEFMKTVGER